MKKRKGHPTALGSVWEGQHYRHGPRVVDPHKCSEFRVGKPNAEGVRLVFGKLKRGGKWVKQSKLTPRR